MKITLNGQVQNIGKQFDNLAVLFEYLLDNVLPKDTVIDKVRLGDTWFEEFEEDYLVKTSPDNLDIEIKTISLEDLKYKTLDNAQAYLHSMEGQYKVIADMFREGKELEANEELKKVIDVTNSLLTFLDTFCETGKEELFEEVTEKFNELIEAQNNGDIVLIADIVEYELSELSKKMKVMFDSIS
jgi:hypothetical protein